MSFSNKFIVGVVAGNVRADGRAFLSVPRGRRA